MKNIYELEITTIDDDYEEGYFVHQYDSLEEAIKISEKWVKKNKRTNCEIYWEDEEGKNHTLVLLSGKWIHDIY